MLHKFFYLYVLCTLINNFSEILPVRNVNVKILLEIYDKWWITAFLLGNNLYCNENLNHNEFLCNADNECTFESIIFQDQTGMIKLKVICDLRLLIKYVYCHVMETNIIVFTSFQLLKQQMKLRHCSKNRKRYIMRKKIKYVVFPMFC